MSFTESQLRDVARLARLAVSDTDVERYSRDMGNILDLVDQLNAADTAGVEPMAHPLHMHQRLRDDVVSETDQRDTFQDLAPATQDGHYTVPKVIE